VIFKKPCAIGCRAFFIYIYIVLGKLKNICNNIIALDRDEILLNIFDRNTQLNDDILQLNKDQLYDLGITADGKDLGGYAPYTLEYKEHEAGKLGRDTRSDHITLKDTGAFYDSFKLRSDIGGFIISADTKKEDTDLITFGKILGLTNENKGTLRGWVKPLFIAKVRAQIFR